MSQIKEISWEYLAGFTDGDGCILVPARGFGAVRIEWTQREDADWVLHEIQEFLAKLDISSRMYHDEKLGGTQTILKVFRRDDVIFCLHHLLPSLIVKRAKALEAMRLPQSRAPEVYATLTEAGE